MTQQIMPGAESFLLKGNNGKAVLLLHGYTGATAEMRPLGNYLHGLGFTVLCPRLPGHGTSVADLEQTTASQWVATAKVAYAILAKEYQEIYVAGLSMGGLLAITVAATEKVAKVAFLSTPIFVPDKRLPFLPLLRWFVRYLPKHKRDYHDLAEYCLCYDKMPTKPLVSLFGLVKEVKKHLLQQVKCPCLIMQSKIEHTVQPKSAQYIYDHVATVAEEKELRWFNHSGHILTLDSEHDQVFQEIGEFFSKR